MIVFSFLHQPTDAVRLIPLLQELGERPIECGLPPLDHAAALLHGICCFADGQPLGKAFPEEIGVVVEHRFEGLLSKREILTHGLICLAVGYADVLLPLPDEFVSPQIHPVVFADVLGVFIVGSAATDGALRVLVINVSEGLALGLRKAVLIHFADGTFVDFTPCLADVFIPQHTIDFDLLAEGGVPDEVVNQSGTVTLEKELQTVIENNMNIFFGVTFLASEYRTTDGGRMDSIGIDENHCPVIFEYKRSVKENVINQGLFYLNWLLDHKDSFKVLVIEKLGLKAANNIDWSMPRVVCVAGDFTKYDESAIKQMNRNISLIRYKKFGEDLLMFEQVNENVVSAIPDNEPVSKTKATDKTFDEQIRNADESIRVLYENLSNYILSLGDDISESHLKLYAAFKKIRNVVTVVAQKKKLILNLPLDVSTVSFEEGFSRDVTNIGHWGCGAVELYLQSGADFEKAKPLIDRAFDEN